MKMRDLIGLIASRGHVDVEFTSKIHDLETYAEPCMRATLKGVRDDHDGVLRLQVSYEKYDEYNKQFESHNYWGVLSKGQEPSAAQYTARETGWYKVEDHIYVMDTDDVSTYLVILDSTPLYDAWVANNNGLSYVAWLEKLVNEHARAKPEWDGMPG